MPWDARLAMAKVTSPALMIVADKPLNQPVDVVRLKGRVMTG